MRAKQLNERSPLRIFERSIHGGLGPGNIGVVLSKPGMGKTSFLVGIAIDDLLRHRKVFHIALEQSVDHVREYYEEIFTDLSHASHLEDAASVRLQVERNRLVHTYVGHSYSMVKFKDALTSLRNHLHFEPALVVIDGFQFSGDHYDELAEMRSVVKGLGAELWMSSEIHVDAPEGGSGELPSPLARYADLVSVAVNLEAAGDRIRIRLVKDHDNRDLTDLYLDLDPQTMLIIER
jgi:hypothetical protein